MDHGTEQDESVLARTATAQVATLRKAVNRYRIFVIFLGVVCAALLAGGLLLWKTYDSTQSVVERQSQQDYASCVAGNTYRSGSEQIWDHFFSLLVTKSTPKSAVAEVHGFLSYIAKVEALRDCKPLLNGS